LANRRRLEFFFQAAALLNLDRPHADRLRRFHGFGPGRIFDMSTDAMREEK